MKTIMIAVIVVLIAAGTVSAQMGGGHMGGGYAGGGQMGGGTGGNYAGGSHMNGGMGYGMTGAGGMVSGMMGNTMSYGYLDTLSPLPDNDFAKARTAIEAFIISSNSSLDISELWEYGTAYKAELSDTNGAKAFDLIADKFTGAVSPEMGFSMMMNASYGRSLYKMGSFSRKLSITLGEATQIATAFAQDPGYSLGQPETYPGYYKFHTTDSTGKFGMDIMVNGYNGGIWMNTLLGVPVQKEP